MRGTDTYGHFELEPEPKSDFDPDAVAAHQKADAEQRKIYYKDSGTDQADRAAQ